MTVSENCAKAGRAGRGKCKTRSKQHYKKAARIRWAKYRAAKAEGVTP